MLYSRTRLLIVDDDEPVRTSLALSLAEFGYRVQCAEDGFSALHAMRTQIPDILLSDLNMPGMSGFELLSVVRRRFPLLQVIAMSGSFSGAEGPSEVAADAFYAKGASITALLNAIQMLPVQDRILPNHTNNETPVWVQPTRQDPGGIPSITIPCPDCLRSFRWVFDPSLFKIHEAECIHCRGSFHFAIVHPTHKKPTCIFSSLPAVDAAQKTNAAQHTF